jgi:UDPglucose--hexose-1-phosphate uridylyltransferase
MSELRRHPFLDTWVATATHRQDRTFLPPDDYCPLDPTKPGAFPTEIPFPDYDIVVFENKFPSLSPHPPTPSVQGTDVTPVEEGRGVCEVVCYSEDHHATFATLPLSQVRKLTRVWKDRYQDLSARKEIEYVFIFENKGKEIGVTLTHPHGQIYAYPFIPTIPTTELHSERAHFEKTGRNLFDDWLRSEGVPDGVGEREVCRNGSFVAIVPFFARYPYEVHIVPFAHIGSFAEMDARALDDLALILLNVTKRYDKLFGFSMPYIMAMHQRPGLPGYDFNRFHVEFYPPYRTANKLKYLAGSEAGAGAFINDTLPEATSKTLRELAVDIS